AARNFYVASRTPLSCCARALGRKDLAPQRFYLRAPFSCHPERRRGVNAKQFARRAGNNHFAPLAPMLSDPRLVGMTKAGNGTMNRQPQARLGQAFHPVLTVS